MISLPSEITLNEDKVPAQDAVIFLTDKYGNTSDKTDQIMNITYDTVSKLWHINFIGNEKTFCYKNENVKIIKNSLKDKVSVAVFDYLMQMAGFNDIKNEEGQNLLVKRLEKARFVNGKSVLAKYLNPSINNSEEHNTETMIFPFGCNGSQFKAVETALNNQVSIIQGPPGTGKTQTILNIIANLIIHGKTVLVVSNNNTATANVYEKLSSDKYQLDFICATLGKKENIDNFLKNQSSSYPEYLAAWKNILPVSEVLLDQEIKGLRTYFADQERIAQLKTELSALEAEIKYFTMNNIQERYKTKKLLNKCACKILSIAEELQFKYADSIKEKFGLFTKLRLFIKYGIGGLDFWKTEEEKCLFTLKSIYYEVKTKELIKEFNEKTIGLKNFKPNTVYDKCLQNLKFAVARKYSKKIKRTQFKDGREIYFNPAKFTDEYPVVLSTAFSSISAIGNGADFLYDYVIMDEASQVDVVTGALALACAKNAVIVGDKMQLSNIIGDAEKPAIEKLFTQTKLPPGYNFINNFLTSVEMILPEAPQTLLREHYRCHPKIINFCNQQFYDGKLLIMTEDRGEKDVLAAIKTVPGNFCKDHCNRRQIDVIKEEILPRLSHEEIKNIGIIAPYNNQINEIHSQFPEIDTKTVHKYQGREKDTIIISTTDNTITDFTDDANMLNVAVSRAKRKLIVIFSGNSQPENSNLAALIRYIQYNNFKLEESRVNSIFDFLYSGIRNAKFDYLKSNRRISKFDSENAMDALLCKITSESKYAKFGFVFEMPLRDIVDRKFMNELPQDLVEYANHSWSHVDFVIFNKVTKDILFGIEVDGYNYHKDGSIQAIRDAKKTKLFELIDLPLLRCSTRGSGEEKRIKGQLNAYLSEKEVTDE